MINSSHQNPYVPPRDLDRLQVSPQSQSDRLDRAFWFYVLGWTVFLFSIGFHYWLMNKNWNNQIIQSASTWLVWITLGANFGLYLHVLSLLWRLFFLSARTRPQRMKLLHLLPIYNFYWGTVVVMRLAVELQRARSAQAMIPMRGLIIVAVLYPIVLGLCAVLTLVESIAAHQQASQLWIGFALAVGFQFVLLKKFKDAAKELLQAANDPSAAAAR